MKENILDKRIPETKLLFVRKVKRYIVNGKRGGKAFESLPILYPFSLIYK